MVPVFLTVNICTYPCYKPIVFGLSTDIHMHLILVLSQIDFCCKVCKEPHAEWHEINKFQLLEGILLITLADWNVPKVGIIS